jgi:hypothetical protein
MPIAVVELKDPAVRQVISGAVDASEVIDLFAFAGGRPRSPDGLIIPFRAKSPIRYKSPYDPSP